VPVAELATGPPGPTQDDITVLPASEEGLSNDFTIGTGAFAEDTSFTVDAALPLAGQIRVVHGVAGLVLLRTARPAVQREAQARANGRVPQASDIGGPAGGGATLPGLFLSLAGGGGGSGVILVLVGVLAVLTRPIVLLPQDKRAFRQPAASWRPSAYVTPIELPG
jgi:hypothetical protein